MGVAGVAAAVSRCCAATKTTLATLREQDPGLARQIEVLTYHGLDTIITQGPVADAPAWRGDVGPGAAP